MAKKKVVKIEEEVAPKKTDDNKMLFWFFVVVIVVFASVLIPYFWIQSAKSFEFGGVDWVVEDYDNLRIFHGRFVSLNNPNLHYNIFLRGDPRTNDVEISGKLDSFKYGGIISLSPEVDKCRGELSRVMLDFGAFLKQGVGIAVVESGTSDEFVAAEEKRKLATCDSVLDRTLVLVEIGEPEIVQDKKNPYCYTLYAEDCEDISAVEKFMVKSVEDFRVAHPRE